VSLQIDGEGRLGEGFYAGEISVASGATFRYSSSADQTLSGAISGAGSRSRTPAAHRPSTLTGNNTYSGGTTVSDGTLRAGIDSAVTPSPSGPFGTGNVSITGGTLDIDGKTVSVGG
jgi:hypothetical protein